MKKLALAVAVSVSMFVASTFSVSGQTLQKNLYATTALAPTNGGVAILNVVTNGVGQRLSVTFINTNAAEAVNIYTNTAATALVGRVEPAGSLTLPPVGSYPDISGVFYYSRATNATAKAIIAVERYGSSSGVTPR